MNTAAISPAGRTPPPAPPPGLGDADDAAAVDLPDRPRQGGPATAASIISVSAPDLSRVLGHDR